MRQWTCKGTDKLCICYWERGLRADLQRPRQVASEARPPSDLPRLHPIHLPQQLLVPRLDGQAIIHGRPRQRRGRPSARANAVKENAVAPAPKQFT